jgi:hypothetical protein
MGITVDNFRAGADRVWFDVVLSIRTKPFDINNRQEK